MNRYLLDTHILLWWLSDDKKLSSEIIHLLAEPNSRILVSAASVWEIVIKKSLKKLTAPDNLKEVIYINNFEMLPITIDHILYLENLPHIHNDPFDRLLIAQCISQELIFITADKMIPKYKIKCF